MGFYQSSSPLSCFIDICQCNNKEARDLKRKSPLMCFGDFAVPQCSLCPHNESCTYAAWLFHLFHVNFYCVSKFEKPHLTRYKPGRIFLSHKFKQGHYVPLEEYLKCWIIVFGVQYFSALGLGPSCIRTVFSEGSWSGFSLNPLSK